MEFINRRGETIELDPFNQQAIDAAKAAAPGEGVGPAVAGELFARISDGTVTSASQLPPEYRRLGALAGLPV